MKMFGLLDNLDFNHQTLALSKMSMVSIHHSQPAGLSLGDKYPLSGNTSIGKNLFDPQLREMLSKNSAKLMSGTG